MKKILLALIIMILASACGSTSMQVEVHNPSAAARSHETVEIDWTQLAAKIKGIRPEKVVVRDAAQQQIPSQVLYEGQTTPQKLIFQVTLAGAETSVYTIGKGRRERYPVQAYGRFVPERMDDYAWENNLGAYRVYGPALSDPVTPGIDVWVKSTDRMIIDDWYARGDYHTNRGEGMDAYKVGPTLGGGASAPYLDGKLWLSGNYEKWERLDNGPIRTSVKLTYAPFIAGNTSAALEKTISLDAHSYFSRMTDVYTGGFETMPVAAGIIVHDGIKADIIKDDYIGIVEPLSDTDQPEIDGDIALGIIMPGAPESGIFADRGHLILVKNAVNGEPLVYWSGAGWSQAGVEDAGRWQAILLQKREQISNPLLVTIQ